MPDTQVHIADSDFRVKTFSGLARRPYQQSDSSRMLRNRQKDNSDHAQYRCGKRRGSVGRARHVGAHGNADD
jgi:hypothetical protein